MAMKTTVELSHPGMLTWYAVSCRVKWPVAVAGQARDKSTE